MTTQYKGKNTENILYQFEMETRAPGSAQPASQLQRGVSLT